MNGGGWASSSVLNVGGRSGSNAGATALGVTSMTTKRAPYFMPDQHA